MNPATDDPQERARLRASLAGFEDRLRRCQTTTQAFLDEHWTQARHRSELAFLLGQLHSLIAHCRDLQDRYRIERTCLAALDATMPAAPSMPTRKKPPEIV